MQQPDLKYKDVQVDLKLDEDGHLESVWRDASARVDESESTYEHRSDLPLFIGDLPNVQRLPQLLGRLGGEGQSATTEDALLVHVGQALLWFTRAPEAVDTWTRWLERSLSQGLGVRLRLNLCPKLDQLPWELLHVGSDACNGVGDGFLALHPRMSIVRTGRWGEARGIELKDLSILAAHTGGSSLHHDGVPYARLGTWADARTRLGLVSSDALAGATVVTFNDLRGHIAEAHNLFHFSGHGVTGDPPTVLFAMHANAERDHGNKPLEAYAVPPGALAALLKESSIDVAVIAACNSGIGGWWSAFGPALLERGVPAVVSMQALLSDEGGDVFCAELYGQLRQGVTLDAAVTSARIKVRSDGSGDWWLPMLHTASEIRFNRTHDEDGNRTRPLNAAPSSVCGRPRAEDEPLRYWFSEDGRGPQARRVPRTSVIAPDGSMIASADHSAGRDQLQISSAGSRDRWTAADVPGLSAVLAVAGHRGRHASALVKVGAHLQVVVVYPDGEVVCRPVSDATVADGDRLGAWTGESFWWIDVRGTLCGEGVRNAGPLPSRAVASIDVACGGTVWLTALLAAGQVHVLRRDTALMGEIGGSEVRTLRDLPSELGGAGPLDLSVVRTHGAAPSEIVVAAGDRASVVTWSELERT